jgi:hypothetical protein
VAILAAAANLMAQQKSLPAYEVDSLLAETAPEQLDSRRGRRRRRRQPRSRLDHASPEHAPAQRNPIDLARRAAGARVRRRRHAGVVMGRTKRVDRAQPTSGRSSSTAFHVDHRDRVWLGSGGEKDSQILAFTREGKFLMQIGVRGRATAATTR